ncbi:MAG TPA: redoxin domain-containing protein [Verrucomicrobiae bacterium]|nr:redoxin domain-containing protein [Verrucomicrobiae bacterium]
MKSKLFGILILILLAIAMPVGFAAPVDSPIMTEVTPIITDIKAKVAAGKTSEADLKDNLTQLDALIAKHKGEKTDDAAQLSFLKASLYLQLFENDAKGLEILNQIKSDYAGTKAADMADKFIAQVQAQAEADKVKNALKVGTKFPDFNEQDLAGKSLSIANYKGKVVMLDFWATWCGPCVGELPNVQAVYQKHHAQGLEIIGISLDEDKAALDSFLKKNSVMTWQQYFDGLGWSNKLAKKYGVNSIPATYLLDGNGNIIGKDLRGEALEAAVTQALAKK